jgi:hypothetical protein
MRFFMRQYLLLLFFLFSSTAILAENDPNQWLANQKISFTENKGQIADKGKVRKDIFYVVQGKGVKVYFTKKGLIYNYIQTEETFFKKPKDKKEEEKIRKEHPEQIIRKGKAYGMELLFENASDKLAIKSEEETGETSNYYLSLCPDGITGVKNYQKIIYENIYENIDLVFYSNEQGLKYDFIVKPGGKVEDIKLRYKDIDKIKLLENGNLEISNPLGKLTENKPFSYQNNKKEIKSSYKLKGRTISFQIDNYDKSKNLIIDPSIVWSTYYEGNFADHAYAVATDKDGNVYLAGTTMSPKDLSFSGFQNVFGGIQDAFLVKFNSTGQRLWATYYGGDGSDFGYSVATDAKGNVFITGTTFSKTNIAFKGFQNNFGGGNCDAFLVKFNSSGQRLWATYYGGDASDDGRNVTVDSKDNIFIAGDTHSSAAIAVKGFQNNLEGGGDVYLAKFDTDGKQLWSTYYGGSDFNEKGKAVVVDLYDNVYLLGNTSSPSNISFKGFQNNYSGEIDAFLVKFSSNGERLWATYFGGSALDNGETVATDKNGNVYIAGFTLNLNGLAYQGFQNNSAGNKDAFLVKFSSDGERIWATYFGGSADDMGNSLVVDKTGNIYMSGTTYSSSGIAFQGFQNNYGGTGDSFVVKFNSVGQRVWSTYFGGESLDYNYSITAFKDDIYLAGETTSKKQIAFNKPQSKYTNFKFAAFLLKFKN